MPSKTIPTIVRAFLKKLPISRFSNTKLFAKATQLLPGGVSSPVRSFYAVQAKPIFVRQGKGATIVDVEGNVYTDFCLSWGALPLGHAHPQIVKACSKQARLGSTFGIPTTIELDLAQTIKTQIPWLDKLRFVSSGTEATMTAIRLARGYTNRSKIVKFDGCYHGHSDALLVGLGSGGASLGISSSAGVPASFTQETIVLPYNNVQALETAILHPQNQNKTLHTSDIACIIVEPVAANMGLVLPTLAFWHALRNLCTQHGIVLIFDEVITGFRVSPQGVGGLPEYFSEYHADLYCFGKIIGGGFPAAAVGGNASIMDLLAPLGPVYQAGTLSGNPVAMAGGLATLRYIQKHAVYSQLEAKGKVLDAYVQEYLQDHIDQGKLSYQRLGSMFCFYIGYGKPPQNYTDAKQANTELFSQVFQQALAHGIYLPPSQFEACFLCLYHTDAELKKLVQIIHSRFVCSNRLK
jgi:glutamate-1-semialdehyde 2,1-aminomutase